MSETILQEAERLINGDRAHTYGDASESFWDIADRWSQEIKEKLKEPLTAFDVAHLMMQMKLSRAKRGFHRDSYVDIAGYAGLTEKLPWSLDGVTAILQEETGSYVERAKRQWQSFLDIPEGVSVTDCDGDHWYESDIQWEKDDPNRLPPGRWAPYTEVLGG